MARVLGIGGVFFKTTDVEALEAWYVRVLGFELTAWGGVAFPPLTGGKTAWSPFASDTDRFEPSAAAFMVNYVVDDLDGLLDHVRGEEIEVLGRQDMEGVGRFAWIMDPAGAKIELWQPAEPAPAVAPA